MQLNRTRVDALDLAQKDIKLRQLLWETSEEWETSIVTWYDEPFSNINIENATNLTAKTIKNCTMFEKNFPDNAIVGKVRKAAELFKTKLPVFAHLRNPALKGVYRLYVHYDCRYVHLHNIFHSATGSKLNNY